MTQAIFALDFGTTKFCLARLYEEKAAAQPVVQTVSVRAQGMRRGMVEDFLEAKKALLALIEKAELEMDTDIHEVTIGVAGSHITSRFVRTSTLLTRNSVNLEHLSFLKSCVKREFVVKDKEIIHTIPVKFKVDNRDWVDTPLQMTGNKITANHFIIDANKNYLIDLIKLCNSCGLKIKNIFAEPWASSMITVSEDAKRRGVLIADIGGGTTDGIIYISGKPVRTFTVNIGGHLMSNDLALGLGISLAEAERLKLAVGLPLIISNQSWSATDLQQQALNIGSQDILRILKPRIMELGQLIENEIKPFANLLKQGVILTGGGSNLAGLTQALQTVVSTSTVCANPTISKIIETLETEPNQKNYQLLPSRYATVIGLLYLELREELERKSKERPNLFSNYLNNFFNWVKELA